MTSTPSPSPRPCPFCGVTPEPYVMDTSLTMKRSWAVECQNPDCIMAPFICDEILENAITVWNSRPPLNAPDVDVAPLDVDKCAEEIARTCLKFEGEDQLPYISASYAGFIIRKHLSVDVATVRNEALDEAAIAIEMLGLSWDIRPKEIKVMTDAIRSLKSSQPQAAKQNNKGEG